MEQHGWEQGEMGKVGVSAQWSLGGRGGGLSCAVAASPTGWAVHWGKGVSLLG